MRNKYKMMQMQAQAQTNTRVNYHNANANASASANARNGIAPRSPHLMRRVRSFGSAYAFGVTPLSFYYPFFRDINYNDRLKPNRLSKQRRVVFKSTKLQSCQNQNSYFKYLPNLTSIVRYKSIRTSM